MIGDRELTLRERDMLKFESGIHAKVENPEQRFASMFINKYKDIIDQDFIKKYSTVDADGKINTKQGHIVFFRMVYEYLRHLGNVRFDKNIMFVCNTDLANDIFTTGLFSMHSLGTFFRCNAINLVDIWFGNIRASTSSDDYGENNFIDMVIRTEQDLVHKFLFIFIDRDMYSKQIGKVVNSVIVSRQDKRDLSGGRLHTWVFFKGSISDLENDEFKDIYRMFSVNGPDFSVIDLNKTGVSAIYRKYRGISDSTAGGKTVKSQNTVSKSKDDSLKDIY